MRRTLETIWGVIVSFVGSSNENWYYKIYLVYIIQYICVLLQVELTDQSAWQLLSHPFFSVKGTIVSFSYAAHLMKQLCKRKLQDRRKLYVLPISHDAANV